MEGTTMDVESKKKRRGHTGKRRHRHHSHGRRKRETRYFKYLTRRCACYGLYPPSRDSWLHRVTRHGATDDPLSPFVAEFRMKFRRYRTPKLAGGNCEPLNRTPAVPFDFASYLLDMATRNDSCIIPKNSKPKNTKYFWTPAPCNNSSTNEDDDGVDYDVLVLGPETRLLLLFETDDLLWSDLSSGRVSTEGSEDRITSPINLLLLWITFLI